MEESVCPRNIVIRAVGIDLFCPRCWGEKGRFYSEFRIGRCWLLVLFCHLFGACRRYHDGTNPPEARNRQRWKRRLGPTMPPLFPPSCSKRLSCERKKKWLTAFLPSPKCRYVRFLCTSITYEYYVRVLCTSIMYVYTSHRTFNIIVIVAFEKKCSLLDPWLH